MSYQALYRKYRSKTFDEVYGQQHIVKTLQNALINNKIGHAYLFTGPRGTGKTSIARLLAKALNCEEGIGHICNNCENCKTINSNSHPDVIEIDAASNSRVEEIRNIIEQVRYAPIKGRFKVYIIDEVHMLSNNAFNALLKTLEEPPEQVIFILATTEPYKVLPTIISRCQRFDFTKIEQSQIKARLEEICDNENIKIDNDALFEISSLADGGMRDALSILDELIAYCGNNIKYEDILNIFGIISKSEKIKFISYLLNQNGKEIINKYYQYSNNGIDIKHLNDDLINIFKDLLTYNISGNSSLLQYISKDDAKNLLKYTNSKKLNEIIQKLIEASSDFKNVSNINSYYELVLLNIASDFTSTQTSQDVEVAENESKPTIKEEIKTNIVNDDVKKKETVQIKETLIKEEEKTPAKPQYFETEKVYSTENTAKEVKNQEVKPLQEEVSNNKPNIQESQIVTEEPKEKKVDLNSFHPIDYKEDKNKTINSNDLIKYSDNTIIKAIVKSSREEKVHLYELWNELDNYRFDRKYGLFVTKLQTTTIFTLCDQLLILQTNFETVVDDINSNKNNHLVVELIEKLINKKINVYAISLKEASRLQHLYYNLAQVNKLPKKDKIGDIFDETI